MSNKWVRVLTRRQLKIDLVMHKGEYFLPQKRERDKERNEREGEQLMQIAWWEKWQGSSQLPNERERAWLSPGKLSWSAARRLAVKADDPAKDGYGRARIEHELQSYTSDVVEGNDSYQ